MITKKSITTLSVAALLAAGGIAVAQTSAPADSGTNPQDQTTLQSNSSGTMDQSAQQTPSSDTSTLGASSTPMGSSSTTENTNTETSSSPVAQVDRN